MTGSRDRTTASSASSVSSASPAFRHLTVAEVSGIARIAFGREPGLREGGLLESAVHRPRARMFGVAAHQDVYAQAAALLHGLAANHPFVDGNKRTAWLAAATLFALHGVDLAEVDQDAAYELVVAVAAGRADGVEGIAQGLRALVPGGV